MRIWNEKGGLFGCFGVAVGGEEEEEGGLSRDCWSIVVVMYEIALVEGRGGMVGDCCEAADGELVSNGGSLRLPA